MPFGVLFGIAGDASAGSQLFEPLADHFTQLAAFSFLAFNLLCAPCFAAIGAIRREMNNAKWTWFAILYQTSFAYGVAFVIFQIGKLAAGGNFALGTLMAMILIGGLIVYLILPPKSPKVSLLSYEKGVCKQ